MPPYVTSSGDHWFIPALAGFAIGRMLGHRDYYYPAPYYGGGWGGPYRYRPDRGGGWDSRSYGPPRGPTTAETLSRGRIRLQRRGTLELGRLRCAAAQGTGRRDYATHHRGRTGRLARAGGKMGFHFHTPDGVPYWDESAHYRLTLREVEQDLENPTEELHEMCMDLVSRAVRDEEYLRKLAIPPAFWDFVRTSWLRGDPHLYGRMDLAYDGHGPAKLYELNYDTPTSLYECAVFQWVWLEQGHRAWDAAARRRPVQLGAAEAATRVRAHRLTAGCCDSLRFDP